MSVPFLARGACLLSVALATVSAFAQTAPEPPTPGSTPSPTTPAPAGAPARPAAPAPAASGAAQRVEITGNRDSDTQERRQSTAAKIVIGREEIDKFGDATVGEVLRRLPGVTTPGAPGRGGPPRMRGLGSGYTQLLIDGQRIPPGFSLESLTPEQIERIEILRAPTAETGARAIAGTINIITREGFRRRLNDLRLGVGYENDAWTPGVNWTHNDSAGPLTYNLSGSLFRNDRRNATTTTTTDEAIDTGAVVRAHDESTQVREERRGLNISGRLQWRLNEAGDFLALQPNLFTNTYHGLRDYLRTQTIGTPVPRFDESGNLLPAYDTAQAETDSHFTAARLNAQWRQRLGGSHRLEVNGGLGRWVSGNSTVRQEYVAGSSTPLRTLDDDADTSERSLSLNLKLSTALGGGSNGQGEHSLVTGLELDRQRRTETRTTLQNGQPLLADFGDNLSASSLRIAAFAQDEWTLSPNWSAHAGVRWEQIDTRGDTGDGNRPENRSSVVTPLLHAVWKPDPKSRDQVRFSLTRSYRAPQLGTLIAKPSVNSRYPTTGPNTLTSPDRAGNPDLKPELATGLDVAIERYLEGGGVISANVFTRRISDLMRNVTALETVSWSPVQRYVVRQQNVGNATTSGIEMDAKFRLDQAIAGALPVELRANLSLYRSSVEGVPGPDNRLDSQAKATGNFGGDYRLRSMPLTVGGTFNWVPGYRTTLSDTQVTTTGSKRVFDAFALWTFSPTVGLRLTATNLTPDDYVASNSLVGADVRESTRTATETYTNWQLRLELKL